MTLAASLRPVAFSVQVQTAPNLPLEREEAESKRVPKTRWEEGLCSAPCEMGEPQPAPVASQNVSSTTETMAELHKPQAQEG